MPRSKRSESTTPIGGLRSMGGDTFELVVEYVKQETLQPLKGLGRFILFGVAGSLAISVGLVILAVGLLRLLQDETGTVFAGTWSWVPYVLCAVAMAAVSAAALVAVVRGVPERSRNRAKETR